MLPESGFPPFLRRLFKVWSAVGAQLLFGGTRYPSFAYF
jgi:hypothetical protein